MPVMKTKPITRLYSGVLICVLCCSCYVSDGNPFVDVKLSAEAKKRPLSPAVKNRRLSDKMPRIMDKKSRLD